MYQFFGILAGCILAILTSLFVSSETMGAIVKTLLFLAGFVTIVYMFFPWLQKLVQEIKFQFFKSRYFWGRFPWKPVCICIAIFLFATHLVGYFFIIPRHNQKVTKLIGPGVVYSRHTYNGCKMHTLEVDLEKAQPVILSPQSFALDKTVLSGIVSQNPDVVAAVNGDFFDEGGPQGLMATTGRLTAPNKNRAALEFTQEGNKAEVELFRFSTTAGVEVNGDFFPLRYSYNTLYTPGDVGVYTSSRGIASGAASAKCVTQARVILLDQQKEGSVEQKGIITEVVKNPSSNLQPKAGEVILTAGNEPSIPSDMGVYGWAKKNWVQGVPVSINLAITPAPSPQIISGGPELIRYGHYIVQEEGNANLCFTRSARTAVGITKDGKHLLVVLAEGSPKWGEVSPKDLFKDLIRLRLRNFASGLWTDVKMASRAFGMHFSSTILGLTRVSKGMTLQELTRYFNQRKVADQPITFAINLDGGGSSTMVIKNGSIKITNNCTEGCQRKLANALGFIPRKPEMRKK